VLEAQFKGTATAKAVLAIARTPIVVSKPNFILLIILFLIC
jgi:hypothetical protein